VPEGSMGIKLETDLETYILILVILTAWSCI
jgi:hypothetical protein